MKIPLTIKHKKEDLPFFTMTKSNLSILLNIEFKKMWKEENRIVDDWIKNKRCLCSKNKMIQEKKIHLDCGHINKRLKGNKIIEEADKKITRMSSALMIRNLTKHEPFAKEVREYIKDNSH